MFQLTFWSLPPLLAAMVASSTYFRVRKKKRVPGMHAVLALLAAVLFWSAAQFVGSLATDLTIKTIAAQLAYFGVVLTPVAWFGFAISYTRRQMKINKLVLNLICVIPLVTVFLVMTNEWHQLIWTDLSLAYHGGVIGLVKEHGPWFYVHAIYSYGLLIVATTILAWAIGQATGESKPVLAVIFAPLVACLANLFYLSPFNPFPWFDMTTLGFAAAALILDRGVLRYGVLDSIPVLRDRVVEQLVDGVVVINHMGIIVDINAAALDILDTSRGRLASTPITEFVTTVSLTDLMTSTDPREASQQLEITLFDRTFDVSATRLDETDPLSDVVLVLRDITDRRKTEMDLRQVQEELVRLAHTDYLTGIHNRRFFMQRLAEEIERVKRHGSNLSVLLFDLDHFKRVNDTCGHNVGDQILKAVADVSVDVKRITDIAARIGGEEFALLLPQTDQTGAVHIAQRLRKAISDINTEGVTDQPIEVTASIGVATVGKRSRDLGSVLNYADEALYKAKNTGRNAVCCAEINAGSAES